RPFPTSAARTQAEDRHAAGALSSAARPLGRDAGDPGGAVAGMARGAVSISLSGPAGPADLAGQAILVGGTLRQRIDRSRGNGDCPHARHPEATPALAADAARRPGPGTGRLRR